MSMEPENQMLLSPLPVQEVIGCYSAIGSVLAGNKITGAALNEIMGGSVSAECVVCGIRISGEELGLAVLAEPGQPLPEPKLERIRLGYCARADCKSRQYAMRLASHPLLDWRDILPQLPSQAPQARQPFRSQSQNEAFDKASQPPVPIVSLKAIAVLAIILITAAVHLWLNGTRIPWVQPEHAYRIDASSVDTNNPAVEH